MKALSAIVLSLTAAAAANASIVSTTGQVVQVGNPPVANFPNIVSPIAWAWDEQQGVNVATGVFADITTNPGNSTTPSPGLVFGTYNSHFIHWSALPPGSISGTVTFDGPIAAVIYGDTFLDLSDATFGALGTAYPTGLFARGLNTFGGNVSVLANTISFNFGSSTAGNVELEQVRVLTRQVPAPGAAALLGLGGLVMARRRRA